MMPEAHILDFLLSRIHNPFGVSGLMGNLYAESALNPKNLQNSFEKKTGYTDDTYTDYVQCMITDMSGHVMMSETWIKADPEPDEE